VACRKNYYLISIHY